MIEQFCRRGYRVVDFGDPADVCVINTCSVTHISDRKSRAMLRRAVRMNPRALVVATGCVAQVDRAQLEAVEGIGLIVSNQEKGHLVDKVQECLHSSQAGESGKSDGLCPAEALQPILYSALHQRTRAFVKVQDGCQSFCSYCIVPKARGPLRSKAPQDIQAEIRRMLDLGYKEIVLTGIHTGLYGADIPDWDLTRLVEYLLASNNDAFRIRLSSVEAMEWHSDLLELIARESRICKHFHIPLQSGSDRILRSMRRRYTREDYRQLLWQIARLFPDAAFTADVMVGYPTETEADFQETYDLLQELPVYELHVFKYSPRAGTIAAELHPQVEAEAKQQRSQRLLGLGRDKRRDFLQRQLGKRSAVLVERKLDDDHYVGTSDNYIEVHIRSQEDLVGQMVQVTLVESGGDSGWGIIRGDDYGENESI